MEEDAKQTRPSRAYSIREVLDGPLPVARPTLYELINSGQLRTFKVGRRRFVTDTALSEFFERREQAVGSFVQRKP